MQKEIILASNAPQPIGPYSQAVLANGTLYISGQIAIEEAQNGSIESETIAVLNSLESILVEAGFDWSHIVKTTIFLSNMDDFAIVNKAYAERFSSNFPARETVEVSKLPKGVNVEISAIAVK
ncbi:MAG: RidA family protein [Leadbetterella sp.]